MQRYNEFGNWLKEQLGVKAQKISLNAGFVLQISLETSKSIYVPFLLNFTDFAKATSSYLIPSPSN